MVGFLGFSVADVPPVELLDGGTQFRYRIRRAEHAPNKLADGMNLVVDFEAIEHPNVPVIRKYYGCPKDSEDERKRVNKMRAIQELGLGCQVDMDVMSSPAELVGKEGYAFAGFESSTEFGNKNTVTKILTPA